VKGGKIREEEGEREATQCSSGRGGVARNYSVAQGLSTLVLTKVRALSGGQVATHSKTCSSIASGPLRANSGISISSRGRRGARGEVKEGKAVSSIALIKSEDTGGSHGDDSGAVQAAGEGHAVTAGLCSPGSAGRAAWGSLGGSWAARLLRGGLAATARLGCSGAARLLRLGSCCWAARLGGSAAAAGRLGEEGVAGPL
ncbi:unnamed protein product, partial [Closterium sp. NIES-54]